MRLKGLSHRISRRLPNTLGLVAHIEKVIQPAGRVVGTLENGEERAVELERWVNPTLPKGPIYVSSLGMAVKGIRILSECCIITPDFPETRNAIVSHYVNRRKIPVLKEGTIIGMPFPQTYGDWFRQGLLPACRTDVRAPLIFPHRFVWEKGYAKRDLTKIGVPVHVLGEYGVIIENPQLMPQSAPPFHWLPGDIDLIRNAMGVRPVSPRPGSILYLSREGETGTTLFRKYLSLCIEGLVRELGGRVVRAKDTKFEDYLEMGRDAETVIGDHGAAMCNMAWWRPKKVIEIQSAVRNDFFNTMSFSAGAKRHVLIDMIGKSEQQLVAAVRNAINAFPVEG